MTTSPGTDYVTRAEFEQAMLRIDARFALLEARIEAMIERLTVTSIRWTVGVSFGLYALMFGLILFVVSREIPHV
jgi:hypothetical protein